MKYTELDDCEEFYHKVEYYNKTKTEQLNTETAGRRPRQGRFGKNSLPRGKSHAIYDKGVSRESGGNSAVGTF